MLFRSQKKPVALWNIIKGTYDGGETIFDAAKRECKEEASIEVDLVNALGAYVSEESGKMRVQFNFLALAHESGAAVADQAEQLSRGEAIEEVCWFTKEEIAQMHPDEFVSARASELLADWATGTKFSLESYKQVEM